MTSQPDIMGRPAKPAGRPAANGARARTRADAFFAEIELLRRRWDVLGHPFYSRWTAGDLSRGDLRVYASEYHHAVEAIATASRHAAAAADGPIGGALVEHALEEREHVDLWLSFARALGWNGRDAWAYSEDPLPTTVECAEVWAGSASRSLAQHLVTLYAVESAQPRIARTKLEGLRDHYGVTSRKDTAYFRVHASRDAEHAELARIALTGLLDDSEEVELLDQVETTYRSNWRLLDGVDELASG